MKVGSRLPMFGMAAALLGLIAVLATLQYRWLGQVSAAERERMQANLATRASAFAREFDKELTRAYLTFQLDPLTDRESLAAHVAERYDSWQATSSHPRLVRDVFVATRDHEGITKLQRFSPSTRFVEPADWPEALAPVRDAFSPTRDSPVPVETRSAGKIVVRTTPQTVWASVPALVVPAPMMFIGSASAAFSLRSTAIGEMAVKPPLATFMVVALDRGYISGEMLPALARQHFSGSGDGIDYAMAVVAQDAGAAVYSSQAGFTPDPKGSSDAAADMFQVRVQEFGAMASEVRRFTSFITTRIEGQRGDAATVRDRLAFREAPVSIMVQHGSPADKRALETSLAAAIRPMTVPPSWRLIVKHPSGSLETAVSQVRRRNLLVSSGILGVLGVSIGFLIVSTRRAQHLARQQMEFVAAVSHELRTPLAVIRSAADNLADGIVHDDPQVKQYGALVRGEGRRLTEMVEQILELAGIQSGQRGFALAPVAVAPLLEDVVSASATLIEEAKLAVEYDLPDALPPVLGEEQALRRVFQNLVGNAIKYGAPGGWIGLRARVHGREVEVTVGDRGMGIEPAEQARIFEPFYRAPGVVAAQIHGAGLGLSLVQRIVEAHGGRITVRSAPGSGSEFTVHLPAASEEPSRAASAPDPAPTFHHS